MNGVNYLPKRRIRWCLFSSSTEGASCVLAQRGRGRNVGRGIFGPGGARVWRRPKVGGVVPELLGWSLRFLGLMWKGDEADGGSRPLWRGMAAKPRSNGSCQAPSRWIPGQRRSEEGPTGAQRRRLMIPVGLSLQGLARPSGRQARSRATGTRHLPRRNRRGPLPAANVGLGVWKMRIAVECGAHKLNLAGERKIEVRRLKRRHLWITTDML